MVKILPAKSDLRQEEALKATSVDTSVEEYARLKVQLYLFTLALAIAIVPCVWWIYGWNVALSYLLGAFVGIIYLRMLARGIDRLGTQSKRLGISRFAVFIVLIVISARREELRVLPAFLGFLTYKISVLAVVVRDLLRNPSTP